MNVVQVQVAEHASNTMYSGTRTTNTVQVLRELYQVCTWSFAELYQVQVLFGAALESIRYYRHYLPINRYNHMRNWTQHLLQAASCKYEYSTSRLFRSPYCTNSQSTPTGSRKSATASLPSHFICFFCVTNCHFSSILDCILHSHCIQLNYRISHVVPGTQDQLNH